MEKVGLNNKVTEKLPGMRERQTDRQIYRQSERQRQRDKTATKGDPLPLSESLLPAALLSELCQFPARFLSQ